MKCAIFNCTKEARRSFLCCGTEHGSYLKMILLGLDSFFDADRHSEDLTSKISVLNPQDRTKSIFKLFAGWEDMPARACKTIEEAVHYAGLRERVCPPCDHQTW